MPTDIDRNVAGLRLRLAALPNLGELVAPGDAEVQTLARAWQLGAIDRSEPAPFIELLFGKQHELRLAELEAGIPGLGLSGAECEYFRGRIAQDKRGAHAPGVAGLAELMVGVHLKNAGAAVGFVEAGRGQGVRTPDIEASRGAASVTLEVTSFHISADAKAAADAEHAAFMAWKAGSPVPDGLKGRVSSRPGLKIMESSRQPLGPGTLPEQIYGLARKLREKADHGQLSGRPNPVLVVDCWHAWGINATDFDPSDPLEPAPPYWAALYGKAGEVVTDGVEFEGASLRTWTLGCDGVLAAPGDATALLWLFQSGRPLLAKRATGASPLLDSEAERLLIDAFDPIVMAPG